MIYTNKFINFISLIITIIIFIILNLLVLKNPEISPEKFPDIISNISIIQKDEEKEEKEEKKEIVDLGSWYIKIPSINLEAPISEGTSLETLNSKVGHFEETSKNQRKCWLSCT